MTAQAEMNKISKYRNLDSSYPFVLVAIETCGLFGPKGWEFFWKGGRQVKRATKEENAYEFCYNSYFCFLLSLCNFPVLFLLGFVVLVFSALSSFLFSS